jgi:MFS transporter, BCD family, chlorophyll transporter
LNRIMIADMQQSALWVSLLVSLPYLLSPLQVLIGSWADRHPVAGRYRSPWIVLGGLMAAFGGYFTSHAIYWMQREPVTGTGLALTSFLVWGIGINIASVSYLSLLSELTDQQPAWRSRTVSLMWTAMILSTIATGIGLGQMLEPFSEVALFTASGVVWAIACLLILLGASRLEPRATGGQTVRHSAHHPRQAFAVLANNPSARNFFVYLLLVLVSIHAQDVLLEPFGAEVLGMPVAATTRLSSIWGVGVFLTLVGGLPLVRRWGKKTAANVGAYVTAAAFGAIIVSGMLDQTRAFQLSVLLLGLGGGLMTVSNLSFMLDMTVPGAAGLYMGAWGVANFAGQALGNITSGLLRDVMLFWTQIPAIGYYTVFGLEVVGLLVAVALFRRISVESFQRDAQLQLHEVLALAGD